MLNASVGVQRVLGRLRRPRATDPTSGATLRTQRSAMRPRASRRRVSSAVRRARSRATHASSPARSPQAARRRAALRLIAARSRPRRRGRRRGHPARRLGRERLAPASGPTGTPAARPATGTAPGSPSAAPALGSDGASTTAPDAGERRRPGDPAGGADRSVDRAASTPPARTRASADWRPRRSPRPTRPTVDGPFLDDGTLLKPVAVDTTVADGSALVKTYKVQAGDTLTAIAAKFGVSMMTLWWANDLKSKDDLHIGQVLRIPPVTGLVVTVTADRHARLRSPRATRSTQTESSRPTGSTTRTSSSARSSSSRAPRASRSPTSPSRQAPTSSRLARSGGGGGGSAVPPATYSGGRVHLAGRRWRQLHQPVLPLRPLRARHRGRLRLARRRGRAAGTVIFAGWKNNGGGYQVWIAARLQPVHDVQPHVGDLGRARPVRRPRPAGRPGRPVRQRHRAAPPLRGLDRRSGTAARGSTRSRYL